MCNKTINRHIFQIILFVAYCLVLSMLSLTKLNLIGLDYHTVFLLYLLLLNHTYHLSIIIAFLENILISFDNKSNYLNYFRDYSKL